MVGDRVQHALGEIQIRTYFEAQFPVSFGAEARPYMGYERCGDRRKVNVLENRLLRSFVGVSRMNRVRNEEVHKRAGI